MLSGEGNENGEKTIIGLINKKETLHVQHIFCTFRCPCFARLQRKTSRNFLVTRLMEEMSNVALFLVKRRRLVAYFLFFSVFLFLYISIFVDMTISVSLILYTTRIQKQFPFFRFRLY